MSSSEISLKTLTSSPTLSGAKYCPPVSVAILRRKPRGVPKGPEPLKPMLYTVASTARANSTTCRSSSVLVVSAPSEKTMIALRPGWLRMRSSE